jgi:predicted nucleic acid-binding protein
MTPRAFLDTNVLVYAYDRSEPLKQSIAFNLLDTLANSGTGVISAQVLSEFFVTVTRKISEPLTFEQGITRIKNFCQFWTVLEINEMIVLEAIRGVREYRFSFWDAQIWAAARLNQVNLVLSEDFSHGSFVEGVRFINPFLPEFNLHSGL